MELSSKRSSALEVVHVLFMDIVGYSRLPIDRQTQMVGQLQHLVRSTAEFRRAEADSELIPIPTGDGMALVFFRDPEAPVRCALEIARAAQDHPDLSLRMGAHSGPVYLCDGINGSQNVAGSGINFAQRVMDCGDARHILLSGSLAGILSQISSTWEGFLRDLGACEVKHGAQVHIFNLCTGDLGNPELPQQVKDKGLEMRDEKDTAPHPSSLIPHPSPQRVALLYKRKAQPDEQLLNLLEIELKQRGFRVFIDRHLTIGVEWAKEIEREVRTADAVIPLISEAAISSEMLAYEIQCAHDAAQQQDAKPRILPVRIQYEGPLPEPINAILDPLVYALWRGPEDNQRLIKELVHTLRTPATAPSEPLTPPTAPSLLPLELEPVGGAVPLGSKFYVVRSTDAAFLSAVARRDSIILIKGARQMGKTSLLARGLQQAREAGAKTVVTDIQKFNANHLASVDVFLRTLAASVAHQLNVSVPPKAVWDADLGANVNLEWYLRSEVLGKMDAPLVWGLDEVDRLFTCDFGSEVFGLFRSWHNERALDPSGPWSNLTLVIAYATEAHLFIRDLNQSPFNVGTRLVLGDFAFAQVADLNQRYGSPLKSDADVSRYFRLVGGHPYLVRRGLHEIVTHSLAIAEFETQADRDEGPFGDHLRRLLVSLSQDEQLLNVVRLILRGQPCPDLESFYRLTSAGVTSGASPRDVRPRCQLYATYLEKHLL